MRVLITGGSGFLGSHVVSAYLASGHEVTPTRWGRSTTQVSGPSLSRRGAVLDVTDRPRTARLVARTKPDLVFHFAGQAFVEPSWRDPSATMRTNLLGTWNLLEAVRRTAPRARVVFAGSGTEYGSATRVPTPESAPLQPSTPYAASKAAGDLLCREYARRYGADTIRLRIFGTTGPGKVGDACNDFASQIALAESDAGSGAVRVGRLDRRRDISDVRDAVEAMRTIAERGNPGEAYNVGSGDAVAIREVLSQLISRAARPLIYRSEGARFRRADEPVHFADNGRLRALGWRRRFPLSVTLQGLLDYWRERVRAGVRPVS
ncbi:MAG TPA: SDR family NAD(P)-dependent oxidoreductase [Thermoplasmata archaeon]|nr:SDR family NAD(P)-dependent oxidoreductase [Thermoplasmata archaeon]